MKFNSHIELETLCKLTYKQGSEEVLRKTWMEVLISSEYRAKGWLINSLGRAIYRIGHLQC